MTFDAKAQTKLAIQASLLFIAVILIALGIASLIFHRGALTSGVTAGGPLNNTSAQAPEAAPPTLGGSVVLVETDGPPQQPDGVGPGGPDDSMPMATPANNTSTTTNNPRPVSGGGGGSGGSKGKPAPPTPPSTIPPAQIIAGDTVRVDVLATGVTDLGGAQFDLTYDPSVLRFTSITEGPFLDNGNASAAMLLNTTTPSGGRLRNLVVLRLAQPGRTGSGVLASATFTGVSDGSSDAALANVLLSDSQGTAIASSKLSVQVTVT